MWRRIFARNTNLIQPHEILEELQRSNLKAEGHFKGDDLGWTSGELIYGPGSPIMIDRYLTVEDNLRHDLNTWAAELETMDYSPNNGILMERVIQTAQMFTIRIPIDNPDETLTERIGLLICQYLARCCDGVYQIDGEGWFDDAGHCLLQEY
jgi:hypothetical protein